MLSETRDRPVSRCNAMQIQSWPLQTCRPGVKSMSEHNLQHTLALLAHTPAALRALLFELPEAWTFRNEGEGTWSVFDVVGHLIHGERTDWMARARLVLQ